MDAAKKLDQAIEYIAKAREELKNGKVVVLEGFQNEVKKLCDEISALPQDKMQQFSPKINRLSEQLKILERELREQQTMVQQDLFGLNRKHKALKTYQTVSHSHKISEE